MTRQTEWRHRDKEQKNAELAAAREVRRLQREQLRQANAEAQAEEEDEIAVALEEAGGSPFFEDVDSDVVSPLDDPTDVLESRSVTSDSGESGAAASSSDSSVQSPRQCNTFQDKGVGDQPARLCRIRMRKK